MDVRKVRSMWLRERSQRFAALAGVLVIICSGLPVLMRIGPVDLGTALPLVVFAVFLTFLGARYSYRLGWFVLATVAAPVLFTSGEEQLDAVRNALFVSVGTFAIAWAHRQQRWRLQKRARVRRQLVGRVKSRARQLQRTGSELQLAVERSETAHRTLLEHLPVHVLQKDLDGRFVFVSQSFSNLLGHDNASVLGKTDYDFYDADVADKFRQDDQRVTRDGKIVDDVERTRQPDGTLAYMQVRKAPLRDNKGQIIGVQGIFWDVTETLSGRMELQRIESWAHALIQAALDAVLIVDIDGRVLEVNPAVATILGYELQGQEHPPLGDIMRPAVGDVPFESAANKAITSSDGPAGAGDATLLNSLLNQATGRRIEVRLRRPDDSWFDAEISAHPLVVEHSSGWAIFIRDITRRKRSVTELRSAKEAAERANLAKSEFVANVSHELRTPLTGIVGLHELMERSALDDQQREYLSLAKTSSDNLLALIDALLDFSKIEAHRLELEHEPFDLIECVESASRSLAARAQLRGLEMVIDCAVDLPRHVVGDWQRVRQVLLNLIGNAIKFTDRGDIQIRVQRAPDAPSISNNAAEQSACRIRFDVIDAGIGITEETQAVIFEAFRQADSSTTRRYGGTGLGLAICKELVHLMRGTISVSSEPGAGSTFTFVLPLPLAATAIGVVTDQPQADETAQASSLAAGTPVLEPLDVVLAAAESLWQQTLQRDLTALGMRVACVSVEQLIAREPKQMLAAGNHTIIIADYRELVVLQPTSLPVVARVVLANPMAFSRPTQPPAWLKHADYRWLQRPVTRGELQRALSSEAEDEDTHAAPQAPSHGTRSGEILLVEDSPINQTVLQGILRELGHQVTLARNGQEAVQKCAARRFDAVLMDIQMPEVDGLEATRRIRAHEAASHSEPAYIIALTAHAMPSDREQTRLAGMNGFLVKPIPMEALRVALQAVPALDSGTNLSSHSLADTQQAAQVSDWIRVEELMGGNTQLATEVVMLMRTEASRLWDQFQQACEEKNARDARRAVHTLKSNLRNLGLEDAASLVGEFEVWSQASNWQEIAQHQTSLAETVHQVIQWCAAMLKQRMSA